ncbi:hypothetical protein SUGI_0361360 [Cryptomeria japonica]|nr:hypothetical protein SUGI_0361360 [Cryptomeria japonica]
MMGSSFPLTTHEMVVFSPALAHSNVDSTKIGDDIKDFVDSSQNFSRDFARFISNVPVHGVVGSVTEKMLPTAFNFNAFEAGNGDHTFRGFVFWVCQYTSVLEICLKEPVTNREEFM